MSHIIYMPSDKRVATVQSERLAKIICQNVFNQFNVKLGYTPYAVYSNTQYDICVDVKIKKDTRIAIMNYCMGFATAFDVL